MSTLIAGFAVWGGIGWLLDQWWGTRLMTPIGLIVGMALGIYAVVARHGRPAPVRSHAWGRATSPRPRRRARRRRRVPGEQSHVERAAGTHPTGHLRPHPKGDRVTLSMLSVLTEGSEGSGGAFEAPSIEHAFFFDRIGDGTVIASVKAMVLLVLGTLIDHGVLPGRRPQGAA